MTTHGPNTPGIAGYALNLVISDLVLAFLVIVPAVIASGAPEAALIYVSIGAVVISVVGIPVGIVGALAMQLCWRAPQQPVHVAVGGVAGALATLAYLPLLGIGESTVVNPGTDVLVGVAAAIGRAAVIPLVESRRRLAAAGRLTGTARW